MKKIRLWQIPVVRRKYLCGWTICALLFGPSLAVAYCGWSLFPFAFPAITGPLLAFLLLRAFVALRLSDAYAASSGDVVRAREDAPDFWDATCDAADRLGIATPRMFVLNRFRDAFAISWGVGATAAVGVNRDILRSFTSQMVRITAAHEVAHLRMGDAVRGLRIRILASWVSNAAVPLFVAGLVACVRASTPSAAAFGISCCMMAIVARQMVRVIARTLLPRLLFLNEYAADAVAIAVTGDPEAFVEVMMVDILEREAASSGATMKRGNRHLSSYVRIRKILDAKRNAR